MTAFTRTSNRPRPSPNAGWTLGPSGRFLNRHSDLLRQPYTSLHLSNIETASTPTVTHRFSHFASGTIYLSASRTPLWFYEYGGSDPRTRPKPRRPRRAG